MVLVLQEQRYLLTVWQLLLVQAGVDCLLGLLILFTALVSQQTLALVLSPCTSHDSPTPHNMQTKTKTDLDLFSWLTVIAVVLVGGVTSTVFVFNSFITKDEAQKIEKRLERIEDKLDAVLKEKSK
jgi:magnesium-transporting ATPase (P-type)